MSQLQRFFEVVAKSICRYSEAALAGYVSFENSLLTVADDIHQKMSRLSPGELRSILRDIVSAPIQTQELIIGDAIDHLNERNAIDFRDRLQEYMELIPETIYQVMRRPGDSSGTSVAEMFTINQSQDWLIMFPSHLPQYHPGENPPFLDNWKVENLRGLGSVSEVWDAYDDRQPELSPACLKFVPVFNWRQDQPRILAILKRALAIEPYRGLIPLRNVYFDASQFCMEYVHLPGYDIANYIRDCRVRSAGPHVERKSIIIKRTAKALGKLHTLPEPIVHRAVKPSNVIFHPTIEGKVTIWISDIGWGEVSSLLPTPHLEMSQVLRRGLRGSYGPFCQSPQQKNGDPPDPRDDVYALGVIWYQLLKHDLLVTPVPGRVLHQELLSLGLTDSLAKLLMSCVSEIPKQRPANAHILADLIQAHQVSGRNADSGSFLAADFADSILPTADESLRPGIRRRSQAEESTS